MNIINFPIEIIRNILDNVDNTHSFESFRYSCNYISKYIDYTKIYYKGRLTEVINCKNNIKLVIILFMMKTKK